MSINFKALFTPFFSSAVGGLTYGTYHDYFLDALMMIKNLPEDVRKQAIEFLKAETSRSSGDKLAAIQKLLNNIS